MLRKFSKKRVIAALGIVAALALAAGAYAFFTSGGSGTGSAGVGTASAVTVHQTTTVSGLLPGGPSVALAGNFDNPGSGPVQLAAVTGAVTSVTPLAGHTLAANGKPDCTTGDFQVTGTSTVPGSIAVGNGIGAWSGLSVSMKETNLNQDNCQGASIAITYTAS
ncbi:MAG: hypothetical protein ACXVCO_21485 [Ktedonobacterales bacterium]